MAAILVVDDDKNFLLSLVDGLKAYNKSFEVFIAENGKEAIKVLKTQRVDLMITDLKMPEMDGFSLLAYMVPHYPHIPVIVITAFSTTDMEDRLMNMGTFKFLEKPLDFHVLVEKIQEGLDLRSHYFTKVLSLCSFLQMIELEEKTCTVYIRSQGRLGHLYFIQGALIDGETEKARGEEAITDIVRWEAAEVEMNGQIPNNANQNGSPFNYIINKEISRIQEATRFIYKPSPPHSREQDEKKEPGTEAKKANIKEKPMNIAKLNQAIEMLKDELGAGLMGSGIVTRLDGKTIVDYNSNPKAGALFSQITKYLMRVLKECNMPPLGKYYFIHLADDSGIIAVPLGDYEWRITIDLKQVTLGLLLNVTVPKILNAFQEAAAEK